MLATYRAYGRKSSHQTGVFGSNLELYVGNLQGLRTEVLTSHGGVWVQLGAVCWQPTGLKDGSLDVKQGCLGPTWSCMLATYRA